MKQILSFLAIMLLLLAVRANAQDAGRATRSFDAAVKLAKAGRFADAGDLFSRIDVRGASSKFSARVAYNLGVCRFRTGDAISATAHFERAIAFDPGYSAAFYALGMARADLGENAAAESAFRQALALRPDDGEAWFDLGLILVAREAFDEAFDAFSRAIERNSVAVAYAHNNIGVILALRGDESGAAAEFRAASRISNGAVEEASDNLMTLGVAGIRRRP